MIEKGAGSYLVSRRLPENLTRDMAMSYFHLDSDWRVLAFVKCESAQVRGKTDGNHLTTL